VTPAGFKPIAYEMELEAGSGINEGDGYGFADGELLGRGVGEIDGVGEPDGIA
jgi:hypothetical protein